jgi:asparagine synthase (glutamine-hydrolysing)
MPGIVGLVTRLPRARAEAQLLSMVETLRHESFYTTGTWVDERLGVYLGWSTRQNSFSDGMPLRNETGEISLVFSGEEFPEPGIASRLRQRGHNVDPRGSSYLVHRYEEEPSFPAGLNGWFQGFLVDQSRGLAMLFNDRYSMHRLYYHEAAEAFYFAAEAKAILQVRPELRTPDWRGLGELISCGCALDNRTFFRGVSVLPPASAWTFGNGSLERKATYFQPQEWEAQEPLDAESYYRELQAVFTRNLPRYFNGHETVGMSLTGGLDGRMIMACHRPEPGRLPCYTFGEDQGKRQCRDVVVAEQVARACHQTHQVIPVGAEFLSRFAHYAERTVYLTDGCLSLVHSPDLYLNEKARNIAPVRLTGNYGSEVLRFSRAFRPGEPSAGLFPVEVLAHVKTGQETYWKLAECHPVTFAAFRQAPWHQYGILSLEQTQLSLRSPFLDNDLVQTAFRAPLSKDLANAACLRLIAEGNSALGRIPTDRGVTANPATAFGSLRRSTLEFFFKAEYAYDSGMPHWLARIDHSFSALRPERLFLGRHKFHHFRVWYRDLLADYVREILLDPRTLGREYLHAGQVQAIVDGHLSGRRNYTYEIHNLLTLELLHRLFLDPN